MATLAELAVTGVSRVYLPMWDNGTAIRAYLQLDLLEGGFHGPLGHLYDPMVQKLLGLSTPQDILIVGDQEDRYLAYEEEHT